MRGSELIAEPSIIHVKYDTGYSGEVVMVCVCVWVDGWGSYATRATDMSNKHTQPQKTKCLMSAFLHTYLLTYIPQGKNLINELMTYIDKVVHVLIKHLYIFYNYSDAVKSGSVK